MDTEFADRHGFLLKYQDGMAVLIVPPREGRQRQIYVDDVMGRMKLLGIPPAPAKKIREIIGRASGMPEKLIEWPAGEKLCARLEIRVSEDGMEAIAEVEGAKHGGAGIDARMMDEALKSAGVVRGVNKASIQTLLEGDTRNTVIARGKEAAPGSMETMECLFITDRGKPWKQLDGGQIDLRELNHIQNRKAGDLLTRVIGAIPSVDGFDVYGRVIEAESLKPGNLFSAGHGVSETNEGLVADIDGNVRLLRDSIVMEKSIQVENVDYSVGNIDFDGSAVITGKVADGFTVRASGDLHVQKTVGRAYLEAGRNLVISGGLVGDGEGSCKVGGNLFAGFLENSIVEVEGNLLVTEAILHSKIEVGGNVYLNQGRGEIIGGLAIVGGSISCRRIGGSRAGLTRIYTGCPPRQLKAFQAQGAELKALQEEVDDLNRQINFLRSKLNPDLQRISYLVALIAQRRKSLREGGLEFKKARRRFKAPPKTVVAVKGRINSDTVIAFALDEYRLAGKELEHVVLKRENEQTVVQKLSYGEKVTLPEAPRHGGGIPS